MRSRVEWRAVAEWVLRVVLAATLASALAQSVARTPAARASRRVAVRGLQPALEEATRSARVAAIAVEVDSLPSPAARAWLVAARRAGVAVTWSGAPDAIAVAAERSREPDARVRVTVVADSGAPLALADSAGALDSVTSMPHGGTLVAPTVVGIVRASRSRYVAATHVPDAVPPRAVLVLARAGWEGKFVAAALQEAGWTVRSRQSAAPGVLVADPALLPVDTSRYAVVVALDSTAADLSAPIARFVGQGGGLVLGGTTPALPAFAPLAPAQAGARHAGRILLDADTLTRGDLPARDLVLRSDALRFEGTAAMGAVRRAGLGRVATVGYDETWRWRMMGGTTGPAAHREWWSRTVGMVAPERVTGVTDSGADAAPVAALVTALGPPGAARATGSDEPGRPLRPLMLLAIVAALLAETGSRRFRGAR